MSRRQGGYTLAARYLLYRPRPVLIYPFPFLGILLTTSHQPGPVLFVYILLFPSISARTYLPSGLCFALASTPHHSTSGHRNMATLRNGVSLASQHLLLPSVVWFLITSMIPAYGQIQARACLLELNGLSSLDAFVCFPSRTAPPYTPSKLT